MNPAPEAQIGPDVPLRVASLVIGRPTSLDAATSSAPYAAARLEEELESLGTDVARHDGSLPPMLHRVLVRAGGASTMRSVPVGRLRLLSAGLRRDPGRVLLQMNASDVEPPRGWPIATLDDATVKQAVDLGVFGYWKLSPRAAQVAIDRQRRWYERALVCFSHSRWHADSIVGDYGIDPGRVVVTGGAFDPVGPGAVVDRDWAVPRFLFAGLNWERKNGRRVVDAFRAVREARPEAELHLMGHCPTIDEPGVVNHGFLRSHDPAEAAVRERLFRTCTCLVVPSIIEPSGSIHAEALDSGMPVIGTTVGGNRETIGPAGVVVDPHDTDAVTRAMFELSDPGRAKALGALGHDHVRSQTFARVAATIHSELLARTR